MIPVAAKLSELLALLDEVWDEESEVARQGSGCVVLYSNRVMFKIYVVSVVKKLWARRAVWRYLKGYPEVASACGLTGIPDRRTLDRRLHEIAPQAEAQLRHLGLILVGEGVTEGQTAASDGTAFATPGPVWHQKAKEAGQIPDGLTGLDEEADWIQSTYHGWVYGYKAHVTISVAPTTVRVVLDATVTGSAYESRILQERLPLLPTSVETLLLDAGYDSGALIDAAQALGLEVLVPLAKPIGLSTSQARRDRAAYLTTPEGKDRYQRRGSSIEPFFATLKAVFDLNPLPDQGRHQAATHILLALYAWNLVVLFNFLHERPLGAVKSFLELL
jgi:hypothetical protein